MSLFADFFFFFFLYLTVLPLLIYIHVQVLLGLFVSLGAGDSFPPAPFYSIAANFYVLSQSLMIPERASVNKLKLWTRVPSRLVNCLPPYLSRCTHMCIHLRTFFRASVVTMLRNWVISRDKHIISRLVFSSLPRSGVIDSQTWLHQHVQYKALYIYSIVWAGVCVHSLVGTFRACLFVIITRMQKCLTFSWRPLHLHCLVYNLQQIFHRHLDETYNMANVSL